VTALTAKWLARRTTPATVATVATLDRSHWKDRSLVSQPVCDNWLLRAVANMAVATVAAVSQRPSNRIGS
jgi:hypothetical protein